MSAHPAPAGTVILGVSASIAAYTACDLARELRTKGAKVVPVLSRDAHHFVTPLSLESVCNHEVYQDFFQVPGRPKPIHIELAKAADVLVVAPASADILARLSLGLADDIITCVALATEAAIIVAPAMNDKMLAHPATREHLARLKERGVQIIDPVVGELVCTGQAMGHIADKSVIVAAVLAALKKKGKI